MWALYFTTWDVGQFVQVMVPVMHAQQTPARGVCLLPPPPQCTIYRRSRDLSPKREVNASLLLRSLNGQVRPLQTNNPWQNSCHTRLAHTQHPIKYLRIKGKRRGTHGHVMTSGIWKYTANKQPCVAEFAKRICCR